MLQYFPGDSSAALHRAVVGYMKMGRTPIILAVICLSGCNFFRSADSVRVRWPETPVPAFGTRGATSWTLRWYAADRSVQSRRVEAGESPRLILAREIPLIVSALPETETDYAPWRSRPAGFAAPIHEPRRGEARLSWEDGFAADFLLNLAERGVAPHRINIERFVRAVHRRGSGRPWDLDGRRLASNLRDGHLRIYSFKSRNRRVVTVPLPAGILYSTYPPDSEVVAGPGGWNGSLATGFHFFLNPAAGLTAGVEVDGSKAVTVLVESFLD